MSATPALSPGQSPPLFTITPTNQSGVLVIATALGFTFGLVSLIIRGYVRYEFAHSFGWDDIAIAISFIFSIFQSASVFVEIKQGLGKTVHRIDTADLISVQKASYAADILYIVTLWITKCSMTFFFVRLSPNRRHEMISRIVMAGSILLGVISIFIVALRCDLSHPWIFLNANCSTGLLDRWRTVAAIDIVTEVILLLLPIYIVHGLQMSTTKKAAVVLAFSFRIFFTSLNQPSNIVAPLVLRLHSYSLYLRSSDPTLDAKYPTIYTQVKLAWAIVAATIPCLRPFMTATHTTWGGQGDTIQDSGRYISGGSGSGPRREKKSPLASLTGLSSRISRRPGKQDSNNDVSLRTRTRDGWQVDDGIDPRARSEATSGGDQRSVGSDESKQMMIRRDVEWTVEYDNHAHAQR